MNSLTFTVPGKPMGQPRHRVRVIVPKDGRKPWTQTYDEPKAVQRKKLVREFAHEALASASFDKLEGPLKCVIGCAFPLPKHEHRKTLIVRRAWYSSAPDADNLAKLILDACNGLVYADDRQVCDLRVITIRAAQGEQERTQVTFTELEPYGVKQEQQQAASAAGGA